MRTLRQRDFCSYLTTIFLSLMPLFLLIGIANATPDQSKTASKAKPNRQLDQFLRQTLAGQPLPQFKKSSRRKRHQIRAMLSRLYRLPRPTLSPRAVATGNSREPRILAQQQKFRWTDMDPQLPELKTDATREHHQITLPRFQSGTQGQLNARALSRLLLEKRSQLQYCYDYALKHQPYLRGELKVQLQIMKSGKAEKIKLLRKNLHPGSIHCIVKTIKRWRFPKPKQATTVLLPLLLVVTL